MSSWTENKETSGGLVLSEATVEALSLLSDRRYEPIVRQVQEQLPKLRRQTETVGGKRQTQAMDYLLTLSAPTPYRNLRQILAQVERSDEALQETYWKQQVEQARLNILQRDYENEPDDLKKALLQEQIGQKLNRLARMKKSVGGAIRKIAGFLAQYECICKENGIEEWDEADMEREEVKYHIMRAFEQALCAARSRGGVIDEGNHIYFHQIGIAGTAAQTEVLEILAMEYEAKGRPSYQMVRDWLERMAERYKDCPLEVVKSRGMNALLIDEVALHNRETGC